MSQQFVSSCNLLGYLLTLMYLTIIYTYKGQFSTLSLSISNDMSGQVVWFFRFLFRVLIFQNNVCAFIRHCVSQTIIMRFFIFHTHDDNDMLVVQEITLSLGMCSNDNDTHVALPHPRGAFRDIGTSCQ